MEFGTEFMFINDDDVPSVVPRMIALLQLDPSLKPYRKEIERRCDSVIKFTSRAQARDSLCVRIVCKINVQNNSLCTCNGDMQGWY